MKLSLSHGRAIPGSPAGLSHLLLFLYLVSSLSIVNELTVFLKRAAKIRTFSLHPNFSWIFLNYFSLPSDSLLPENYDTENSHHLIYLAMFHKLRFQGKYLVQQP